MRLVEKAKAEADKLVADARKEADEIVDKARKRAQELDANTKSRLKLYAGQALSALKSEIVNVVSNKLVKDTVKELMGNKGFMGNFMVAVAKWASGEDLVISASRMPTGLPLTSVPMRRLVG